MLAVNSDLMWKGHPPPLETPENHDFMRKGFSLSPSWEYWRLTWIIQLLLNAYWKVVETRLKWETALKTDALSNRSMGSLGEKLVGRQEHPPAGN